MANQSSRKALPVKAFLHRSHTHTHTHSHTHTLTLSLTHSLTLTHSMAATLGCLHIEDFDTHFHKLFRDGSYKFLVFRLALPYGQLELVQVADAQRSFDDLVHALESSNNEPRYAFLWLDHFPSNRNVAAKRYHCMILWYAACIRLCIGPCIDADSVVGKECAAPYVIVCCTRVCRIACASTSQALHNNQRCQCSNAKARKTLFSLTWSTRFSDRRVLASTMTRRSSTTVALRPGVQQHISAHTVAHANKSKRCFCATWHVATSMRLV
jgi:hypothetical protein